MPAAASSSVGHQGAGGVASGGRIPGVIVELTGGIAELSVASRIPNLTNTNRGRSVRYV